MSYGLTEDEQGHLMQAVSAVLQPWMRDRESSVILEGEPMAITVRAVADDAPDEIRRLDEVWMGIVSKGALAVDPDEIESRMEAVREVVLSEPYDEGGATPCDCGASGLGQHARSTCLGRNLNLPAESPHGTGRP